MSGEDSPEIFRDNTQCEQDVNVSLMETERNEEDDQQHDEDDQQHDEDYQQHDEEPAYTPNVPVSNQYDALMNSDMLMNNDPNEGGAGASCEDENADYIGLENVKKEVEKWSELLSRR